ncbi:MAG: hypothetical protein JSW61_05655 [Candidatus Thorarchaeota archaeon]|nr:MAG: hypothetical protein JSW61_05655 [Candidatus Thorarchaeota archaeon]
MKQPVHGYRFRLFLVSGLAVLLFIASASPTAALTNPTTDLEGVAVAVYGDDGVDRSGDSWLALAAMFEWMNASVTYVMASDIRNGTLDDYEIFVMPGGPAFTYRVFLQEDGMEEIINFVSNGGSYFGICGGAEFATTNHLGLHQGRINWGILGYGTGTIDMTLNVSSTGPDFSDMPEDFTTMYWGSGYFTNITNEVIPIARYDMNGLPGMIAFPYGHGSVFLSSPHPEFEEESDRDGTTSFDELDDPDSEWPMLLRVARWLLESSNVTENENTDSIFDSLLVYGTAIIGTAALVAIVAIYVRRR